MPRSNACAFAARRFRDQLIAAPLKPGGALLHRGGALRFRDQLIAAPLKLLNPRFHQYTPICFRDQLIAAPLKRVFDDRTQCVLLWFPRSIDRGPIEAPMDLPTAERETLGFRDQLIAAPLKRHHSDHLFSTFEDVSAIN